MRMKTGIMALAITVVLLMAMVQTVAGANLMSHGKIYYENGTRVDRGPMGGPPAAWLVEAWNLDAEYGSEPWHTYTAWNPGEYDWGMNCQFESDSDRIKVRITSPDGFPTLYTGVNISVYEDASIGAAQIAQDVIVYEQAPSTDTFTKPLTTGWNLISLPLTPDDDSTSAVLGNDTIGYNKVYRYDGTSKEFVNVTTGTMEPGIGYFVYVTTAGTWNYTGTSVSSTDLDLKSGLNMIGVPNCTISISDGVGSADYRYVARWNAAEEKFEVYNPNAPSAFHNFTTITAGEGYFVSASSDYDALTVSCPTG